MCLIKCHERASVNNMEQWFEFNEYLKQIHDSVHGSHKNVASSQQKIVFVF